MGSTIRHALSLRGKRHKERGNSECGGYREIHEFCKGMTLCNRGHVVFHDDEWFHVYCFAEEADADKFQQRFGGERFDPNQRGKGSNWARWKKP